MLLLQVDCIAPAGSVHQSVSFARAALVPFSVNLVLEKRRIAIAILVPKGDDAECQLLHP